MAISAIRINHNSHTHYRFHISIVLKVWFQNRRAKEKRLKKDAHSNKSPTMHMSPHPASPSSARWSNGNGLSLDTMPASNASSTLLANETSTSCSSWFDDAVIDEDSDVDEDEEAEAY